MLTPHSSEDRGDLITCKSVPMGVDAFGENKRAERLSRDDGRPQKQRCTKWIAFLGNKSQLIISGPGMQLDVDGSLAIHGGAAGTGRIGEGR